MICAGVEIVPPLALDLAYLEEWARELDVDDLWRPIRESVFPGQGEEPAGDIH